jgi:hypothetical protein
MRSPNPRIHSRVYPRFAGLLALCLLLSATPAAALSWSRFDSEQGRFSVELPGHPQVNEKKSWFPVASFVSYVYRSQVRDGVFGLNHTDVPGTIMMLVGKKRIIEGTRKGLVKDVQGTEVSFRETRFLGKPAHELVYDMPAQSDGRPVRGRSMIFFRNKRLYVFSVELSEDHPEDDLSRFFDSVQIWGD